MVKAMSVGCYNSL